MAMREALRAIQIWLLRTLIVAGAGEIESTRAALSSDNALGYRLIATVTLEAAATLSDSDLVEMILGRDADFVVVAVGGGNPQAEQAVLSALRRTGLSIGLLPALRGLPVIGFRQHYFLGHDIVMLVRRNNLARPSSRLLKAVFDQVGAIILLSLLAPLMLGPEPGQPNRNKRIWTRIRTQRTNRGIGVMRVLECLCWRGDRHCCHQGSLRGT
jgi:hypothetical protein